MLMQEMMSMLGRMNHGIIALSSAMMQENRHLLGGNCLNDYKWLKKKRKMILVQKEMFCVLNKNVVFRIYVCVLNYLIVAQWKKK